MSTSYAYEPLFTCSVCLSCWWEKPCEACWKPGVRDEKDFGQDGDYIQVGPPRQGRGSEAPNFGESRDTQFRKKSPVTCAHLYTYCKQSSVLFNIDRNAAVIYAVYPFLP